MCQGISSSMQPLLYELEQLQNAAPNWQANAICVDTLANELAGVDIKEAYPKAAVELNNKISAVLEEHNLGSTSLLWSHWLYAAIADVVAVVHGGPQTAYYRTNALRTPDSHAKLRIASTGYAGDLEPIALLRAYVLAYSAKALSIDTKFQQSEGLSTLLLNKVEKEATGVTYLHLFVTIGAEADLPNLLTKFHKKHKLTYKKNTFTALQLATDILDKPQLEHKFIKFLHKQGLPQTSYDAAKNKNSDSLGKLAYHLRLSKLKKSAELVANTIMHTPLASLGNKSLLQHSQD